MCLLKKIYSSSKQYGHFLTGKMGFWNCQNSFSTSVQVSKIYMTTYTFNSVKTRGKKMPELQLCVILEQLQSDIDFLWDELVTEEFGKEISILHHDQSGLLALLQISSCFAESMIQTKRTLSQCIWRTNYCPKKSFCKLKLCKSVSTVFFFRHCCVTVCIS